MKYKSPTLVLNQQFNTDTGLSAAEWGCYYLDNETVLLFNNEHNRYAVVRPNGAASTQPVFDLTDRASSKTLLYHLHLSLPSTYRSRVFEDVSLHADYTNAECLSNHLPAKLYHEGRPIYTRTDAGALFLATDGGFKLELPDWSLCTTKMVALFDPITSSWGLNLHIPISEPSTLHLHTTFIVNEFGVHPPFPGLTVILDGRAYYFTPRLQRYPRSFSAIMQTGVINPVPRPYDLSTVLISNLLPYESDGARPWVVDHVSLKGGPLHSYGCTDGYLHLNFEESQPFQINHTTFTRYDNR